MFAPVPEGTASAPAELEANPMNGDPTAERSPPAVARQLPISGTAMALPRPAIDTLVRVLHFLPYLYVIGFFWPPMNHDVAALVETSRRWLGGERLFIDLIDVNTPLTFVLHALPTLLSRLTGIAVEFSTVALVVTAVLASGIASRQYILDGPLGRDRLGRDALPFIVAFVLAMSPGQEFGQREHLMLCGALPYVLLAGIRAERKVAWRTCAVVGLFAGIGFAMKPYFLVIPLLVEAYLLLRRPLSVAFRDPAPWMIGLAVAAHAVLILFGTPAYVENVLPLAFEEYLAVGEGPFSVMFGAAMTATVVTLALLLLVILFGRREPSHILLALLALGGLMVCVMQGKGWSYHTIPAIASTIFLLAVVTVDQIDRRLVRVAPGRGSSLAVGAALLAILAYPYFLANQPFAYQGRYNTSIAKQMGDIIAVEAPNRRIFAFSPGIYPFFPTILYEKTTMEGRYLTMWPIQGLYGRCLTTGKLYRDPSEMSALERRVEDEIVRDFVAARPDIIFVDHIPGIPQCGPDVFDYIAYFSGDPRFVAALAAYEPAYDFDRYTIWRRKKG